MEDVNKEAFNNCDLAVTSIPHKSSTALSHQECIEKSCNKVIRCENGGSRQNFKRHLCVHKLAEQSTQKQTCPVTECGRHFLRLAALRTHLKQHAIRGENKNKRVDKKLERSKLLEQVQDTLCDDDCLIPRRQKQSLHCRRKHECDICGKHFRKHCLLQRHAVVHRSDKPFQCAICSICFTQKSSLQRHFQHNHMCEKTHKCSKCDKCFSQKTNLSKHLQRAHSVNTSASYYEERRFACDRCSCVYNKLNSLNRHKSQYHRAAESESARIEQLSFAYKDETSVDDADALARSVLVELKKLQGSMLATVQTADEEHQNTKSRLLSVDETLTETCIATAQTIVDPGKLHLVDLCDKLNPMCEPHSITVQCIQRSDGMAFYVCEFCAKEFRKTYDLIRHRRTHFQEAPYKCVQCSRCCITKSKFEEHKKVHTSTDTSLPCNRYICSICQQVFASICQLDKHVSLHVKTHSLLYACSICGRSYGTLGTFSKHKHRNQDKELAMISKLLPTPIDISTKASEKSAILPASNSMSKIQTSLKCRTCERLFATKSQLNLHYKIHSTHKQFFCPKCVLKKFPTESRLRRHLLSHTNVRNFKCVYCEKTFKSREHCRQHMQVHLKTLLNEADVEPELRSGFKSKECFVVVQQKEQTASQTYSPPLLQQTPTFIELHMLSKNRRHKQHKNNGTKTMSSNMTGSQNYCSFCQRQFKKSNHFQRHLRTHTKERPFKCNQCAKSFAMQSTLKEHCLTHAQQRITYDCQVCGKSYASKKVLVLHLRIHTGERPFNCQYCEQTFRTSGHRQAHIKAAHKQQRT